MIEPVRLTDNDWEILLPGEAYTLGKTSLNIVPLGIESLKIAIEKIGQVYKDITEKEITFKNYSKPDNMLFLANLILTRVPELLAESSGLHIEDINRLSPNIAVGLVEKVLDVNIKSQEGLEKNLLALTKTMNRLRENLGSETSVNS